MFSLISTLRLFILFFDAQVDTLRTDLDFSARLLPTSEHTTFRGHALSANAYALDFFKHSQLIVIIRDNNLRPTDAWASLKTFCGLIAKCACVVCGCGLK